MLFKKVKKMDDVKVIKKILNECRVQFGENENEEIRLKSIQLVMLVATLEEEFDIEIPDSYLEVEELNTITKIMNLIRTLK